MPEDRGRSLAMCIDDWNCDVRDTGMQSRLEAHPGLRLAQYLHHAAFQLQRIAADRAGAAIGLVRSGLGTLAGVAAIAARHPADLLSGIRAGLEGDAYGVFAFVDRVGFASVGL